ncbi:ABC transporter ATP-binding protein [Terasakiella sp.]|uniref:ABC transporter ATP-binding protein n=1 Tax=Terasakiella sp. TaxID=2034861 RepID=UPI003AA8473E
MLSLSQITHKYMFDNVVEDISLNVAKGEVVSLVGPSGCGKTTLLAICAGLIDPSEGKIKNEFDCTSMVFQEDRLLPWRKAWQNIAMGLKARGVGRFKQHTHADKIAQRLRLTPDDLEKYPDELSGGMRQRVAIGRALAISPDLLLLDEPFSALDIGLRRELQDLVMEQIHNNDLTAVFITHDLLEAVRISSRILVFKPEPGRIIREIKIDIPFEERTDSFVYQRVGQLLEEDDVRTAFDLMNEEHAL